MVGISTPPQVTKFFDCENLFSSATLFMLADHKKETVQIPKLGLFAFKEDGSEMPFEEIVNLKKTNIPILVACLQGTENHRGFNIPIDISSAQLLFNKPNRSLTIAISSIRKVDELIIEGELFTFDKKSLSARGCLYLKKL